MADLDKHFCEKCKRTMAPDNFYRSHNLTKYPLDGLMNQCKKCLTMHVDNWNPDTYLWVLQEIDVPYIPDEWNKLLATYGKDRSKVTGSTILGRYLSKMKLKQWKEYRWKDTEFLQELNNKKIEEAMKRQGYEATEIAQVINTATFDVPEGTLLPPVQELDPKLATGNEDYFAEINGGSDDDSLEFELTEEDKLALRLKWGKTYKPDEWIALEKLYTEMMASYDIQSAGHIDTLKMVCKTSLKANQLLDIGDVDGAQKMVRMYDALMKSGKFTAVQNKGENGEYVNSVGELVAICEAEGFIPRYYVDEPQDKVDRTLQDLQNYTRDLITNETNIGNLIEKAIKDIEIQKQKEADTEADAASDDEALENELFELDNGRNFLMDKDFEEFNQLEEDNAEADESYLRRLLEEGEI